MIIRKITILMLVSIMILTGCDQGRNSKEADKDYSSEVVPNIVECGNASINGNGEYYYAVDMNTGVVYLCFHGYRTHAITVMVNAFGAPITADQLGITTKRSREGGQ